MEEKKDMIGMLELILQPAFCVMDGKIVQVNSAAKQYFLCEGTAVADLLATGSREYDDFTGGCLYLTLRIAETNWGASVTRIGDHNIFVLDSRDVQSELQSMALAAQELRQPLSNVMSVADRLFPIAGTDDDPALQEQVSRINRGLFQMLRIISNMSDAYRYTQQTAPRMQVRDICGFLSEVFTAHAELIRHAGITVHFLSPRESVYCLFDEEMLERAVSNILSNAIKFAPKGSVIDAKLTRKGGMLYLTVNDAGPGIAQAVRGYVYNRYLREPGVEDGRYGIGLGMVLIRSAATAHGGTVLIDQTQEQGTRVTMTITIRQQSDTVMQTPIYLFDYAGDRDHRLIELSESLPIELYRSENIN